MKAFISAISIAITLVAAPAGVLAQMHHNHGMPMQMQSSAQARTALAEGEVRKIDRAKGTITLKHGPLTALDMPPMTMVFVAKQPALLANVKEGDKVRFTPEQGKDGELVVGTLEVVNN